MADFSIMMHRNRPVTMHLDNLMDSKISRALGYTGRKDITMALTWNWEDKCGEATFICKTGEYQETITADLYQGNAFLIMIYEYTENEESRYQLISCMSDKNHAKNNLGLNKKSWCTENIYSGNTQLKKVRINKSKYSFTKDLVSMLSQAFDNIDIEIYSEEATTN